MKTALSLSHTHTSKNWSGTLKTSKNISGTSRSELLLTAKLRAFRQEKCALLKKWTRALPAVKCALLRTSLWGMCASWLCVVGMLRGVSDMNQPSLPTPSLFYSCVYFCRYGPLNRISFHKVSRQLSVFRLCSSGLISALSVLSTTYISLYESLLLPHIIPCAWLGWKHQLTNSLLTAPMGEREAKLLSIARSTLYLEKMLQFSLTHRDWCNSKHSLWNWFNYVRISLRKSPSALI